MTNFKSYLLIALIAFAAPTEARTREEIKAKNQAKAEAADEAKHVREMLPVLLSNLKSKDELLNFMKNARVSVEAYKAIADDLAKRIPKGKALPKIALRSDQVFVSGEATGIQLVSFAPIKVKFRSRVWTPDPDKSVDQNYFALTRFFEKKSGGSALLELAIPSAFAYPVFDAMYMTFGMLAAQFNTMAFGYRYVQPMYYGGGYGGYTGYTSVTNYCAPGVSYYPTFGNYGSISAGCTPMAPQPYYYPQPQPFYPGTFAR